jgi:ribose transport system permease protein
MEPDTVLEPVAARVRGEPHGSPDEDTTAAWRGSGGPWWRFFVTNEFGLIVLIAIFAIIFSIVTPGFTSRFSLYALGRTMAIDAIIGFSMMVVIVTGGLNLSVGAIGVSAVMFGGWLIERLGMPLPLAIVGAFGLGASLGWVNGVTIVKSGVHSFIITLATMSIFFGVMIFLTQAQAYRELPPAVAALGKARIAGYLSPLMLVTIAIAMALSFLYRFTGMGRRMLAAGAMPPAAELSGVRVGNAFIACHVLSGLLAALAAMMLTARTGAAIPSMAGHLGQDWLLPAFLAPVLGGTLLTGGRVAVLGTFLGAVLVSLLMSGLLLLQVGEFWVRAFLGLLLLAAVLLDKLRRVVLARHKIV